jgi:hypothetical protein
MASRNLVELLRCLVRGNVECILVGGMAGVMRGAPVVTADVDVVHRSGLLQGCSQFRFGCTVTAYKDILRQLTRVSVAG